MSLFDNETVLLVKPETTYGTDSVPTGLANAVVAQNFNFTPMDGEDVARGLVRPFLGADATLPAALCAKIAFEVELSPSGSLGVAPAWGPILRGCAVAQTINAGVSVVYNPISAAHEGVTIYFFKDGTRHALIGARGTAKLMLVANAVPKIMFDFTGLFVQPTAVANPAATVTAWTTPQIVSDTNTPTITYNGVDLVMRSFEFDLGNDVVKRFLVNSTSVVIPQRSEKIAMVVEAVPLATLNPYALAAVPTSAALNLVHGVGAGRVTTINAPLALLQRPTGLQQQDGIIEWPLSFVPLPGATGNDQWTITLT
jgi:hypothetical protein